MSKYTTEVRFICENLNGNSTGFNDLNTLLTNVAPKIFNFDFPIFDEKYRIPLEVKILRHYYTREISEETVGLWKLRLQDKLNLIMPYYNQLYSSTLIEFDPLIDTDYIKQGQKVNSSTLDRILDFENLGGIDTVSKTKNGSEKTTLDYNGKSLNTTDYKGSENNITDYTGTENNTSVTTGSTSKTHPSKITITSDTPQGSVDGITNTNYFTSATQEKIEGADKETYNDVTNNQNKSFNNRKDKTTLSYNERKDVNTLEFQNRNDISTLEFNNRNDTTTEEKHSKNKTMEYSSNNGKNDNTMKIKGKRNNKTYSEILQEYRKTFLNIDKMIIDELKDLFFNLW